MRLRQLLLPSLVAVAALNSAACGSSKPEPVAPVAASTPAAAPGPPPAPVSSGFSSAGWGVVDAPGIPFTLRVPDVSSWKVTGPGPWLRLSHEQSQSSLEAKIWSARRGVRRNECERQLRLWRSLPEFDKERRVDQRKIEAPPGFETQIRVDVAPQAQGARGWVVAIGVDPRRCFAAIFTTLATGRGFEQVLGERLGLVSQEVIPEVRVRGIGDRFRAVPR